MFKYVSYEKVKTQYTVLEFKVKNDEVEVFNFDGNIVSLKGEQNAINELIASQESEIKCDELSFEDFKSIVSNSSQIANINRQVKEKIALKYDIADELAMSKKSADDEKRIAYETYVGECLEFGNELKKSIGYEI